jgi:hypothetical protein
MAKHLDPSYWHLWKESRSSAVPQKFSNGWHYYPSSLPSTGVPKVPFNNSLLGNNSSSDKDNKDRGPTISVVDAFEGECASLYKEEEEEGTASTDEAKSCQKK